jgi:hypothetical protein
MKRIVSLTVAVGFLVMSSLVFAAERMAAPAQDPAAKPQFTFEEKKTKMLERVNEDMAKLKEYGACIDKAGNTDELKACHQKRPHKRHGK